MIWFGLIQGLTESLVLDLRDLEAYENFHIRDAVSFPSAMLSRDKLLPELVRFVVFFVLFLFLAK